jgi:glyoxylase-like metal-dependent hydrolase (beta-lactamase superfamily II)
VRIRFPTLVTDVLDAQGSFATFIEAFPAGDEAVARDRYPTLFDGPRWLMPVRSYLAGPTVLVDAGVGKPSGLVPGAQGLLPYEVDREAIELVILTHLHVDHVGWTVDREGRPFFPRARYVVCEQDWHWAESREVFREKLEPLERAGVVDLVPAVEAEVAPGVSVVPAPGHTPGHLCVRAGGTLILGDLAVHPVQIENPRLAFMFDDDPAQAASTRAALLAEVADSGTRVAPGHFPAPFGTIARAGDGFEWRPER